MSGTGTNLEAIARACEAGEVPARVAVVVSNSADAYALTAGRGATASRASSSTPGTSSRGRLTTTPSSSCCANAGWNWWCWPVTCCSAGPELVEAFRGRIINIHPALLPSFPGTHGVPDALAYGVKVSGVTVHFVDEGLDTGPIILQEAVTVREDDDAEGLHQRIHEVEYRLYPLAIKYFAEGRLSIEGRRVRIDPPPEVLIEELRKRRSVR